MMEFQPEKSQIYQRKESVCLNHPSAQLTFTWSWSNVRLENNVTTCISILSQITVQIVLPAKRFFALKNIGARIFMNAEYTYKFVVIIIMK